MGEEFPYRKKNIKKVDNLLLVSLMSLLVVSSLYFGAIINANMNPPKIQYLDNNIYHITYVNQTQVITNTVNNTTTVNSSSPYYNTEWLDQDFSFPANMNDYVFSSAF